MTQEHGEQIQAMTELSEEELDPIAGGVSDPKDPWPPPPPPPPGSARAGVVTELLGGK